MININLVPRELRKKSGRGMGSGTRLDIPQEILLGIGGGCLVLLLIAHGVLFAGMFTKYSALSANKNEWQKLSPDKKKIDDLGAEFKDLKQKIGIVTDVTSQKNLWWSLKLNTISDAVPQGLWLKRVRIDKGGLSIEGTVVSKNQGEIATVGVFVANLKAKPLFMEDFSNLEVSSVARVKQGAAEVANFTIRAKLK